MAVTNPDELAVPLDLLLTSATRPFLGRMMPNRAWARFGANLSKDPATLIKRGSALARELGTIASGKSDRGPARQDKRFADPAWQGNPLMRRSMQAYLAASDTVDQLFDDAGLDWRDSEKMRFVLDNLIEGLSPSDNPVISPLGGRR